MMGKITEMLDRRDIKRRADLRRILDLIAENLRNFQMILIDLKEKDLDAYKRCLKDLENIQPLFAKLYVDLSDISPKKNN